MSTDLTGRTAVVTGAGRGQAVKQITVGGWDPDAIADAWPATLAGFSQTVSIPAPAERK